MVYCSSISLTRAQKSRPFCEPGTLEPNLTMALGKQNRRQSLYGARSGDGMESHTQCSVAQQSQLIQANAMMFPHVPLLPAHAHSGVKQSVSQWTQKIEIHVPSKQPIYPFSCLVSRYTPTSSHSRRITMPQIVFTAGSVA